MSKQTGSPTLFPIIFVAGIPIAQKPARRQPPFLPILVVLFLALAAAVQCAVTRNLDELVVPIFVVGIIFTTLTAQFFVLSIRLASSPVNATHKS